MLGLRAATAAVLLAVFAAALFLAPPGVWIAFCALALVPSAWEWGRLARLSTAASGAYSALLVALFLGLLSTAPGRWLPAAFVLAGLFWVIAAPVWLWRRPGMAPAVLAAVGLIVLVPAFGALAQLRGQGAGLLLAVMAVAWVSDTAAYLVGRRFGRRKLAPAISPGKTWEGFWAALAAVVLYAVAVSGLLPGLAPGGAALHWMALTAAALGLAVLGVLGDLFESQLKRVAGVKDSGRSLPGHGGILDRIDALLPILPVAALLVGQSVPGL
jgi:phosphatidate cytidylyltransferase